MKYATFVNQNSDANGIFSHNESTTSKTQIFQCFIIFKTKLFLLTKVFQCHLIHTYYMMIPLLTQVSRAPQILFHTKLEIIFYFFKFRLVCWKSLIKTVHRPLKFVIIFQWFWTWAHSVAFVVNTNGKKERKKCETNCENSFSSTAFFQFHSFHSLCCPSLIYGPSSHSGKHKKRFHLHRL